MKETSLDKPLKILSNMGLIRRELSLTDDPDRSKDARYVFDDNYSSFWFKSAAPFRSSTEMKRYEGVIAYWRTHFYEHHMAFFFEEICMRSVYDMSDDIGFIPRKVGRYWEKECEIDLMALDTHGKRAFVAECKCRREKPVGSHELNDLMAKVERIKKLKGYEVRSRDVLLVDRGRTVDRAPGNEG